MEPLRVLVVEDSLTIRNRLVELLESDPEILVAGEASDGQQAIELCMELQPDVVTMDMMLPVMSGLAAVEYIMAYCPVPILVVSASTNRGELFKTYEALAAGAIDVMEKPLGEDFEGQWRNEFLKTLKLISRIKVITHPRGKLSGTRKIPANELPAISKPIHRRGRFRIAVLGASTGGPGAIREILCRLPDDFQLPILLVLHIGHPFGQSLAEWMDGQSHFTVRCALDGEPIPSAGSLTVLMAPPDLHMAVRDGRISLLATSERHSCRPSVDVLFESIAREYGPSAVACLLTGMGRDGAQGLLAIRQAGGTTIAQDEASSVVFGMPKEAIVLGAADQVLPLGQIGPALAVLAGANQ